MKNLKAETIKALGFNGKTQNDIKWIGACVGKRYYCDNPFVLIPINKFWEVSDREYDDSYGGVEVNSTLVIVGDDWWLERQEYDGSEWWEFKTIPQKPTETAEKDFLTSVFYGNYL